MAMEPTSIGRPPWTREELKDALAEFAELYETRPISDNEGGMRSPHMFSTWFVLQKLAPEVIVESGVWRGQGTWLLERACPQAKLYCIDPDLSRLAYRSSQAEYFDRDFSTLDWSQLPKNHTVLFFDDHQDAFARVKTAHGLGFKHLLFEDNYPASRGDCYSLKKAFAGVGFEPSAPPASLADKLKAALGGSKRPKGRVEANHDDAAWLHQNLALYQELPPPVQSELTRWGDPWDEAEYPTPEPLLRAIEDDRLLVYRHEAADYTWICYARLK